MNKNIAISQSVCYKSVSILEVRCHVKVRHIVSMAGQLYDPSSLILFVFADIVWKTSQYKVDAFGTQCINIISSCPVADVKTAFICLRVWWIYLVHVIF